jgi:hypothetical protein
VTRRERSNSTIVEKDAAKEIDENEVLSPTRRHKKTKAFALINEFRDLRAENQSNFYICRK